VSDYVPSRKFVNVEGQDTFPVRISSDRMAWLVLPKELDEHDLNRITEHLNFIYECSKDHKRNPGPPEPNGRNP
jgi:hypothetical protein